jgi:hypothetical protein
MKHTQRLCECSRNYNWECNSDPDKDDGHTIELTRRNDKKVYTQVKLCEPMVSIRACKTPSDWTLLALQSERTGKAHYVVVCRCPENSLLEGPYTHNHPPYARIPGQSRDARLSCSSLTAFLLTLLLSDSGIRVYGMLCAQNNHTSRNHQQSISDDSEYFLSQKKERKKKKLHIPFCDFLSFCHRNEFGKLPGLSLGPRVRGPQLHQFCKPLEIACPFLPSCHSCFFFFL